MTNLLRTKKLPHFGVIKTAVVEVMWLAKKISCEPSLSPLLKQPIFCWCLRVN